MSRLI